MPITINSNVASLNAQRHLQESTSALQTSFERLSSGLRINKASDDAAGLAIADSLRADSRLDSQAIRNVNDGISMLSIAEGSLNSLSTILTRVDELAEQSANGVNSPSQRGALNQEAQALESEYNRIIATSSFNGANLLDGSTRLLQVGIDGGANSQLAVNIDVVTSVTGDGTFKAATQVGDTSGSYALVADFNGDGHQDIAYTAQGSPFSVVLGNGDGTFKAEVAYDLDTSPSYWVRPMVGDVNGDGKLDAVVVGHYDGTIAVLLGNGDGSFNAPHTYTDATAGDEGHIALGDFDGDGKVDIVAEDRPGNSIDVFHGNGDGTFKAPTSLGEPSFELSFGDVNGDGKLDLFATDPDQILLGNGDGTFSQGVNLPFGADRGELLVDINGDGKEDALAWSPGAYVNYAFGVGDGTFGAVQSLGTGNTNFTSSVLTVKDLNGDGFGDLIVAESGDSTVSVFLNNGDGTFKARVSYTVPAPSDETAVADFNEDGVPDIIAGGNPLSLLIGNGNATSNLTGIDLSTTEGALSALDTVKAALSNISSAIGSIGAIQSRLQVAANSLRIGREGADQAESQIRDVDVAQESAELAKNQILQQAGAAVLAQANQQPSLALQLLRNI